LAVQNFSFSARNNIYILPHMLLQIKVIPNASKTELVKTETGYKARIQCAPVDGKASRNKTVFLKTER
jgi:uncharacterized protein YggU (UPF0235/DUF167 family)